MAQHSHIEWTQATWNPVTGCSKISAGCKNCYAERFALRLQKMRIPHYKNGFKVTIHRDLLNLPKQWRSPRMIFVNSMSDLFHEDVPLEFIQKNFSTMRDCPQHIFQVLTKRSQRLRQLSEHLEWTKNIWIGVTIEDSTVLHRIADLKTVPATVRFLSCEPLLGPLYDLDLSSIHWVIVGGESGPGARPVKIDWVLSILEQCRKANIPFFFKQWGGVRKKSNGRLLNGHIYDEIPSPLIPNSGLKYESVQV